jgi:hypothetical protein
MEAAIQRAVRQRAKNRCEYCRFPEEFAELPFHLDHIIARQHGGRAEMENLALACCFCNRYKGPNLSSIDPLSGKIAQLFNPRLDVWEGHFAWNGARFIGKTSTGRATIEALQMNRSDAIAVRELLMRKKVYWAG